MEVTHLYLSNEKEIGILGDWGVGAPGLAIKMEELIALGTKPFIAVGIAGGLMNHHKIADMVFCPEALAEDGVAHLYLNGKDVVSASSEMLDHWRWFEGEKSLTPLSPAMAWSFSAIFRENIEDVYRVEEKGCSVVEMEAATLYAIAEEKNVQALTLFVISDFITEKE